MGPTLLDELKTSSIVSQSRLGIVRAPGFILLDRIVRGLLLDSTSRRMADQDLAFRKQHESLLQFHWEALMYRDWRTLLNFRLRGVSGIRARLAQVVLRTLGVERSMQLTMDPRRIGPGLYIHYGIGTGFGAQKVGSNVVLSSRVTVGYSKGEMPTIGNNVYLGVGAVVVGGITVGDGAWIAANSLVVRDVPAGMTVIGVPSHRFEPHKSWYEQQRNQE